MRQLGTCNLGQEVPHTAGSDCRDWNPLPLVPDYTKNTYADLKEEALKQMDVPSTAQVCCLTLAEQVEGLETRYAQEHAWLNDAASVLNCDLDQVAKVIRTNAYRATWKLPPLNEEEDQFICKSCKKSMCPPGSGW